MIQGLSASNEFLRELPKFDQEMESQRKDAEASGEVSRMELVTGCLILGCHLHKS